MIRQTLARAAAAMLAVAALGWTSAWSAERDQAVLAELNLARTDPIGYAGRLEQDGARDEAQSGRAVAYGEDPDDLAEAVAFLQRQPPLPPLRADARIDAAALDHAAAQARSGEVGHALTGAASLGQRLQRRGVWAGIEAEDISYGYEQPRAVIRQLIIDSGVSGRGHRMNIFDPALQAAGVGCAPHPVYGAMCVIDFAGALVVR